MSILKYYRTIFLDENKKEGTCKGLFFRCNVSKFWNDKRNKIESRESYQLLKRKSCSGCSVCIGFYADLNSVGNEAVLLPEKPISGRVYVACFRELSRDWETGYVEDWAWELNLVKDEKEGE